MSQQLLIASLLVIAAIAVIGGGFLAAWLLCHWISERREKRRENARDTIIMRISEIQRTRHLTTVTGLIPVVQDDPNTPGGAAETPDLDRLAGLQSARQGTAA